jgi:hypothetical protein
MGLVDGGESLDAIERRISEAGATISGGRVEEGFAGLVGPICSRTGAIWENKDSI